MDTPHGRWRPLPIQTKLSRALRTLHTAGGDRINVFDNMLEKQPWENSGYCDWFEAMEIGQTDRWMSSPLLLRVVKEGDISTPLRGNRSPAMRSRT